MHNNILIDAIGRNDAETIKKAIAAGADPDVDHGLPLRTCFEQKNYEMAKILFFAGADFTIALEKLRADFAEIPTRTSSPFQPYPTPIKEREAEYHHLYTLIDTGDSYYARCKEALPVKQVLKLDEIIERQIRIEQQLADFKTALDELRGIPVNAKPRAGQIQPLPK